MSSTAISRNNTAPAVKSQPFASRNTHTCNTAVTHVWHDASMREETDGSDTHYDLIVIGSGPAGQKGAICAAKLRKRVAIVDREHMIGGVSLHTGTIPSKT